MKLSDELLSRPDTDTDGRSEAVEARCRRAARLIFDGRHAEAHEHLDRARAVFSRLRDGGIVAQVDETRARVLLAEGRYAEARKAIAGAVRDLEEGGEMALLADALVVRGVVEARLGRHEASIATLREAMRTAEAAGASRCARAARTG